MNRRGVSGVEKGGDACVALVLVHESSPSSQGDASVPTPHTDLSPQL